jgi:hypothetical protein
MRGEEKSDVTSGPSESGISWSRLDDLDLKIVLPTEVLRFDAALSAREGNNQWVETSMTRRS